MRAELESMRRSVAIGRTQRIDAPVWDTREPKRERRTEMYAMVVSVRIEGGQADEAQKALDEFTIPRAKSQEGFVRGVWLRAVDGTRGRGVVIFDNEEHANSTAELARQGPPPGSPVTVENVEVFEVVGEA